MIIVAGGFPMGRTISSFVSLHVIVPPKTITIRDQNGDFVQNSTIGPYDQNSSVVLNCESNGGVPPPTLQWYKNGIMIDGSYVVGKNGQVSNELIIYKLSPQDLYDRYVCQAGNFNSSSSNPIEAFVILDINLLPIDVRILPPNKNRLIAGRKYDFRCETYGSKPTATIRWYRDGKLLTHSTETYESNKTTSLLTLSPTVEDNGLQLECRAYNPKLNSSTPISMPSSLNETDEIKTNVPQYLAADLKLQISFPPQIFLKIFIVDDRSTIWSRNYSHSKNQSFLIGFDRTKYNQNQFGINQDQDRIEIEENSTIIVQCTIKANPSLINLQIQHNGSVIHNDHNLDVNEKNVTEIRIDSIRKEHHGRYQCLASNQQGLSRSKSAFLNVLYLPRCHYRYRFLNDSVGYYHFDRALDSYSNRYALALNESIRLKCHLDSNPKPIKYFWSFDKDRHLGYRFDSKETLFAEASGELLYTIKSSKNYGRIFCWAKNLLGEQRTDFCWFQIIKAGPPDPFQRCQVTNKTTVSLTVECFPGNDGGSRPTFYAQIYEFVGAGDSDGDDEENLSDFTDFDENDRDVEFGRDTFVDRINGFNQSIDDDEDDHRDSDEDLNNFQHNRNTNQQLKTDHIYSVRLDDSNNNDDADEIKNLGIGIERKSKPIQSLSGRKSSSKHKSSASTISLLRNLSSESSPIFFLNHLTPGTFYLIELYAKNSRGKSPISRLKIATLFTKNTKLISSSLHDHEYDSWFSFLIAFLLIIVMVVVAIHIVCRVRNRRIRKAKNRRQQEQIKKNFASPPPETENETRLYNTRDLKQRQQQQQQQQQNQQKETILGEDRDPNILVVIDEKQLMRELLLQQQQQQQRQQNDSDADANISATSATSMATAMLPLNHQQPNISSTINSKDDSSISSSIKHHPNDIISFDSQTSELNSKLSFLVIKEDLTSSSSSSNVMPLMKNLINNTPTLSNDDNFLHNGSFLDNASPSLIGYHHQHQQPSQTMQPNQSQQHSSLIVSSSSPDPLSSSSNSTVPSNYHGFPRPNSNLIHHQSIQFDATNGPVLIDTTSNQQQQHHRLMAYETAATMSPIDPLPDTVSVATLYENSHNKTGSTFFENQSIPTATNLQQNLTILTPLSKHTLSANYGATNHCSQTEQSKFKTSNYHLIDSVQKPIDELDQDQSSTPTATIFYASNLSPHQILSLNDESNTILLSSSNNGFYYAQQQQQQQQQFNPSHHHRSMIETIGGDPNDSIAAIPFQLSATINDDTAIIDHDSIVNATNRSKRVEILNEENFQRNFNQNYTQKRPQQQQQQKQQSQKSSVWQSSTATIKTLDDEGCDTIGTGGGGEIYTDLQQTAV
ncbi:Nephrin [Sarcoptes scabiei]|uniref:Nephrin n=1 Tax=Sarcoptes scabiei TaxID=52283 RepID=A0A834VDN4_SARSC|nr:Nephrin [Sarcoptes scabiei]